MNLKEFIEGEKKDSNLFWTLQSGEHQNLLYEAIEKMEETERLLREVLKETELSDKEARKEYFSAITEEAAEENRKGE
jgi:hypothetical protein